MDIEYIYFIHIHVSSYTYISPVGISYKNYIVVGIFKIDNLKINNNES